MRRLLPLLVLLLMSLPTAAIAHSTSVDSDPEQGAKLASLPARASVTFDEEPRQMALALTAPDGTVQSLKSEAHGSTVTAHLPAIGQRGQYQLAYRVVSADGHPVSGSVTFTVSHGDKPATSNSTPASAPSAESGERVLMWVSGVAILVALGLAVFLRSARR